MGVLNIFNRVFHKFEYTGVEKISAFCTRAEKSPFINLFRQSRKKVTKENPRDKKNFHQFDQEFLSCKNGYLYMIQSCNGHETDQFGKPLPTKLHSPGKRGGIPLPTKLPLQRKNPFVKGKRQKQIHRAQKQIGLPCRKGSAPAKEGKHPQNSAGNSVKIPSLQGCHKIPKKPRNEDFVTASADFLAVGGRIGKFRRNRPLQPNKLFLQKGEKKVFLHKKAPPQQCMRRGGQTVFFSNQTEKKTERTGKEKAQNKEQYSAYDQQNGPFFTALGAMKGPLTLHVLFPPRRGYPHRSFRSIRPEDFRRR